MKTPGSRLILAVLVAGLLGCSERNTVKMDSRELKELAADAGRQAVAEMTRQQAESAAKARAGNGLLLASEVRAARDRSVNEETVRRMILDELQTRESRESAAPQAEANDAEPAAEQEMVQKDAAPAEPAAEPPVAVAVAGRQVTEAAPANAPAAVVVPPPVVGNVVYFYDTLAPYGRWLTVAPYGQVWQPSVVMTDVSWRPYCHGGSWTWTESGWYWNSAYPWGWAPFHYGRWVVS